MSVGSQSLRVDPILTLGQPIQGSSARTHQAESRSSEDMTRSTRSTRAAIASVAALLAGSMPMDPRVAHADTVKDVLCELQRLPATNLPEGAVAALQAPEDFTCDFTQTHAAAYIDSSSWAFIFPHAEQGKSFERQNTEDFIKFTREGQYRLFVYQTGKKPNEPGGF